MKNLQFLASLGLTISAFAQNAEYYDYGYRYEVPCSITQPAESFSVANSEIQQLTIQNYEGQGSLNLKNGKSYSISNSGQCFLSTVRPTELLQKQMAVVKSKIKAIDSDRDIQDQKINAKMEVLQNQFRALEKDLDQAYTQYQEKAESIDQIVNPKEDKLEQQLDQDIQSLKSSCEENKLSKVSYAVAAAKIDQISAQIQGKVASITGQIKSLEAQRSAQQTSVVQTFFAAEKAILSKQISVIKGIRDLYQQKGDLYLSANDQKKIIADTLLSYQKALLDAPAKPYDASSLDQLASDLALSASILKVKQEDKVCRFRMVDDRPFNTHDLRLYFAESPNFCRCEFISLERRFDCTRRLGSTNVPKDVCHLIELNPALSAADKSMLLAKCDEALTKATFENDLAIAAQTKDYFSFLKNIRIKRYRLSHAQPIQVNNPVEQKAPKIRVNDQPIRGAQ